MRSACAAVCLLALLVAVEAQWGGWDRNPWWANGGGDDDDDLPPFRPRPPFPQRPTRPPQRPQTTATTPAPPPTQAPAAGSTVAVDSFGRVPNCDCPAPPQYNPVCGSDGVTYNNPQILECANRCGHPVTVSFVGLCVAG